MCSSIVFTIEAPPAVAFSIEEAPETAFTIDGFAVVYDALPAYEGPVTITPSNVRQTLETTEKTLYSNIVVNPIPSNYGLITWNGATLTVS